MVEIRTASKETVEERCRCRNATDGDCDVYDGQLPLFDYNASEEDADRDLKRHYCCDVCCFTRDSSLCGLVHISFVTKKMQHLPW